VQTGTHRELLLDPDGHYAQLYQMQFDVDDHGHDRRGRAAMRAVVTGMIATFPVGGVAWDYGQYVPGPGAHGLRRLLPGRYRVAVVHLRP